jgi:DNA polymerase-3 subunit delta'
LSDDAREPDQLDGVPLPEMRDALVGHGEAEGLLMARLESGRMPSGVMIHGPRGIGKATLAFRFARKVFAATSDETEEHIAAQVAAGAYPNLFVMRKTPRDTGKGFNSAIRIDEVRRFVEELRMTRGRAGHRVAVIDAIDDCNTASANALLKILEEPPADTTFMLISHRPGGLLPTIRSRCFPLALRPLGDSDVRDILTDTLKAGGAEIDRATSLAAGVPRRGFEALLLADAGVLGVLSDWLQSPATQAAGARLAIAETLAAGKDGAEMGFARDMIFAAIAGYARAAAEAERPERRRLDSATELWDKARLSLADADAYNLDMRQTLIGIFDAIRKHHLLFAVPTEP